MSEAKKKAGWTVGIRMVVSDENGQMVSDDDNEWYGFERNQANAFAVDVTKAIVGVIDKYREQLEKQPGKPRR